MGVEQTREVASFAATYLPNILGPCIVAETLAIPGYILTEAFLSFISLGAQPAYAQLGHHDFGDVHSHARGPAERSSCPPSP